jgi:hypothetical protein
MPRRGTIEHNTAGVGQPSDSLLRADAFGWRWSTAKESAHVIRAAVALEAVQFSLDVVPLLVSVIRAICLQRPIGCRQVASERAYVVRVGRDDSGQQLFGVNLDCAGTCHCGDSWGLFVRGWSNGFVCSIGVGTPQAVKNKKAH